MKLFFFSQILANNNLPFKINCESIVRTFVIKIDTDFNLNVLLKLFFSLSKKIIFFLTNIKIYCENIVIAFPSSFFPFFSLFFSSSTHVPYFFLFFLFPPFFLLPLTPFLFFPSFFFSFLSLPPNSRTFLPLSFFFFFFSLPFSLFSYHFVCNTHALPPYTFAHQ